MPQRFLITGATGFVGGHIAEACRLRGFPLRAIVRQTSDASELERLGAVIYRGDLEDPSLLQRAVADADVVVHCAAKVGDRGPVEDYREVNVEGLRRLLEVCKAGPLHRFVHMSTLGVYESRHHHGTDESEPLPPSHLDGYTQTKVEAEQLALSFYRLYQVPVVVLRPGFVYGSRDRMVLPKLMKRLSEGRFHYLGGDQRVLNCIYVGNLVEAVFLAVDRPSAVGQVYNLTDGERVTKQHFINAVADAIGVPRPKQRLPRWLAALVSRYLQRQIHRSARTGKKPLLTHAQYKFLQLNLDFSIERARRELDYHPAFTFNEGIERTMAWYREHGWPPPSGRQDAKSH
jgi:nucleoside-diphosphate-sugar epimerase